jgi:hypothetical protein
MLAMAFGYLHRAADIIDSELPEARLARSVGRMQHLHDHRNRAAILCRPVQLSYAPFDVARQSPFVSVDEK